MHVEQREIPGCVASGMIGCGLQSKTAEQKTVVTKPSWINDSRSAALLQDPAGGG